jgi:intracellular sulfur oxidation DsrE/DsrF family protein
MIGAEMNIIKYFHSLFQKDYTDTSRRTMLTRLLAGTGMVTLGMAGTTANAHKVSGAERNPEERFPGDPPQHFIVYQLNHSESEYHDHVLGSVGALVGKYADNVDVIVACFGRGIHVLGKKPLRPVSDKTKEKIQSLAKQGVKFHACNRTLTSLEWSKADLYDFAKVVDVGVADIMELQEQNYAYVAW